MLLGKLHFNSINKIKAIKKRGIIVEEYTFVTGSDNTLCVGVWTKKLNTMKVLFSTFSVIR